MRNPLVISLALALAACGGPLLGGTVEEPKVCITRPATVIQGLCTSAAPQIPGACSADVAALLANPLVQGVLASIPRQAEDDGTFPLGDNIPALDRKGTTGSIKLVSFTVTGPESAVKDLDSFDLALTKPNQPAPFATFTYTKQEGTTYGCDQATPRSCRMAVTIDSSTDLFKYLNGGDIQYHVALKGNPQALSGLWNDWSARVEACMSASLTVDALEAMKN